MNKPQQVCPKCGSSFIRTAESIIHLGNPLLAEGMVGWECLECGYIGKNFFITDNKKTKKHVKSK